MDSVRGSEAVAGRGLAACIAAICLYWLSLYLYVPVLAPRAHRLGAGVAAVGLVLASYGFVQFLLRIPTGVWSDRLGRRRPFMLAALVACGVAAAGMGLAHGPWSLGLFRGVAGLGACGWVAITLLFAEWFPAERAPWAFGLVGFLATGSQLVGSFLGGLTAQWGGYAAPFFGAALLAAVGVLVLLPVREPRAEVLAPAPGLRQRLAVGRNRAVLTASGLSIGSHYVLFATTYGFTPLLAVDRFHAGGTALGILSLCAGIPSAGASLLSGRLAGHWSPRRLVATGFALAAAGAGLLVAAPSLAVLDVFAALGGGGVGLLGPSLMTAAVHGFSAQLRGSAMGFYQSIYSVGMFGGPALAGWIGSRLGMGGLFGTTAVLALAAALLAWWLLPATPWSMRHHAVPVAEAPVRTVSLPPVGGGRL
jgi:MFS family permease